MIPHLTSRRKLRASFGHYWGAYVGVTTNPTSRFTKHRYQKPWWRTVTEITLTEYDDRTDAFEAEKRAIADEDPQYNIARPGQETP